MKFTMGNIALSANNPDSRVVGGDGGSVNIHSTLLILHSNFLKNLFSKLKDNSDYVIILPDFRGEELLPLVRLMYGMDAVGIVSAGILDALGLEKFKTCSAAVKAVGGLIVQEGEHVDFSSLIVRAPELVPPPCNEDIVTVDFIEEIVTETCIEEIVTTASNEEILNDTCNELLVICSSLVLMHPRVYFFHL